MNHKEYIRSYQWYIFEKIPQSPMWYAWSALAVYAYRLEELYDSGYFRGFYIFHEGDFFMYKVEGELKKSGRKLLKRDKDEPGLIMRILKEIRELSDRLVQGSRALRKVDVKETSNEELAAIFQDLYKMHEELWVRGQAINLLEHGHSLLGEKLKEQLIEDGVPQESIADVSNVVTTPEGFSSLQKEEQALISLAEQKDVSEEQINNHWENYAWLGYNWLGPAYDKEYFIERIEALRKEDRLSKYKKTEQQYKEEIKQKKDSMIRKFSLSEETLKIAKILEKTAALKAYRVDVSWFFYWTVEPIFNKISKEEHLSFRQVQFLKPFEIVGVLKGSDLREDLPNHRKKMYTVHFHDGTIEEFLGEKARDYFNALQEAVAITGENVKELKGDTGSPGRAKGRVIIVDTPQDIPEMSEGDILVAHTTNPSLVPAMKLAAAVVADIGGVTSHAAIVSRELGIPSVIGTKHATQIFKDGDMVEVDAERGVVRKIGE